MLDTTRMMSYFLFTRTHSLLPGKYAEWFLMPYTNYNGIYCLKPFQFGRNGHILKRRGGQYG